MRQTTNSLEKALVNAIKLTREKIKVVMCCISLLIIQHTHSKLVDVYIKVSYVNHVFSIQQEIIS